MIKTLNDYLDNINKRYPYVNPKNIKKILEFGFNTFYQLTDRGADISLDTSIYKIYCGWRFWDSKVRSKYYRQKYKIKLRLLYNYKCTEYDGYYYFGLTKEEYNLYNNCRSYNKPINVILYKIDQEAFLDKNKMYFYKMYYPVNVGWLLKRNKINSKICEYIGYRDNNNKIVLING